MRVWKEEIEVNRKKNTVKQNGLVCRSVSSAFLLHDSSFFPISRPLAGKRGSGNFPVSCQKDKTTNPASGSMACKIGPDG